MKKEIEFQKCFDVVSTIEFTGIEDDSHMFLVKRHFVEGIWDDEEDEVAAIFNIDGGVELEAYNSCTEEEQALIEEMMHELQEKGSW